MSYVSVKSAVVLAVVLATGLAGYLLYSRGSDDALDKIEKQNDEAGSAATVGAGDWRSCIDAGGVYDFASGKCAGASDGSGQ